MTENDEDQMVKELFQAPEWQRDNLLGGRPEAQIRRLIARVEARWAKLSDRERVGILIRGPQWMREGVPARVASESDAQRLRAQADETWARMTEPEKVGLLAEFELRGERLAIAEREPAGGRKRLIALADERVNAYVRERIEAWERDQSDGSSSPEGSTSADDSTSVVLPDGYDFCVADDGQLGRRRLHALSQIALCGEMYVPVIGRWRLRSEVMSTTRFPAASAEEVVPLLRDAEALAFDCPDPTDLAPSTSRVHADRLEWLDRAIADTLKAIHHEEDETRTEMISPHQDRATTTLSST